MTLYGDLAVTKVVTIFHTKILSPRSAQSEFGRGLEARFGGTLKGGDGNPRRYIKGGNLIRGGLLHPRISATKSHVFASPMDPISMGEGSQEAMKEGG